MRHHFTFAPDTVSQSDTGYTPPSEGYYAVRIEKCEDQKENDGSIKRFRLQCAIEPSMRVAGDPASKISKSYDYADDGKVMKLLSVALGVSEEQLKAQGLDTDPTVVLPGKMLYVYFKPKGGKFTNDAGKEVVYDEFRVIAPGNFQAMRNEWIAQHPNIKFGGAPNQGAPAGQQFVPQQPAPQQGGFQQQAAPQGYVDPNAQQAAYQQQQGGFQQQAPAGYGQPQQQGFAPQAPPQGSFAPQGAPANGQPVPNQWSAPPAGGFAPPPGSWTPPQG